MRRPGTAASARRRAHNLHLPASGLDMTPVWRYLTHPKGMTAQQLAESTGLPIKIVRDDLSSLEAEGKTAREIGPVGTSHRWWRIEKRPLTGLDVLLYMALAATLTESTARLKEVLADVGSRAKAPQIGKIVAMCAAGSSPRQVVWEALDNLEPMPDEDSRAA